MRCYFWGTNNRPLREERALGVVSFAIPDWGVQFRAARTGDATECEYAALLALLRFVENNKSAFEGTRLEFYTDASAVVYQVNRHTPVLPAQARQWSLARRLRTLFPFELGWIPKEQNRAFSGVLELAPYQMKRSLQYPKLDPPSAADPRGGNTPGNS